MSFFDRYTNKPLLEKDLPNLIDFGRFAILDCGKFSKELTYANFQTNKIIRQDLLLDKNKSLQEIFVDISIDIQKSGKNSFEVIPLIRRIKNKLGLNEFEELLFERIFHIEEVFRQPHYLLEREIEKVHVSRAKRIPSKSYQYLASHTEDWIHKSIVNFQPSRILNEELELNFDIYENQLTVAFLERCLVYFNSRLKEIQDIKTFLKDYEKLLKYRNDQKGWYKKIERNLSLIGAVYDDENYQGKGTDGSTLTRTEEVLNQMNKRLLLLRKSELFGFVNKRSCKSVILRNTNVLVNHKHYRYVKSLWIELDKVKPVKNETEKLQYEQDVYKGMQSYTNALIVYALTKNLNYEIIGTYDYFRAEHQQLAEIHFRINELGVFEITIGNQKIKCVVIGNEPFINETIENILEQHNTFLIYHSGGPTYISNRAINIDPLDPDSIERIGSFIRRYLLRVFIDNISKSYEFKHLLKEYIHYLDCYFIKFNIQNYTYKFISYPKTILKYADFHSNIEDDRNFKSKSRPDKDQIIRIFTELIAEINNNAEKLKTNFLNCFNCGEQLKSFNIENLNYIRCPFCNSLIDSSVESKANFKIDDPKVYGLAQNEFGMDYLDLDLSDL